MKDYSRASDAAKTESLTAISNDVQGQGAAAGTREKDRYYDAADQAAPRQPIAHADVSQLTDPTGPTRQNSVDFLGSTRWDDLWDPMGGRDGDWDDKL